MIKFSTSSSVLEHLELEEEGYEGEGGGEVGRGGRARYREEAGEAAGRIRKELFGKYQKSLCVRHVKKEKSFAVNT